MKALDLDEFLDPIRDEQVAIRIEVADVSGAHPAVDHAGRGRGIGIVRITRERLRPAEPELAGGTTCRVYHVSGSTTLACVAGSN